MYHTLLGLDASVLLPSQDSILLCRILLGLSIRYYALLAQYSFMCRILLRLNGSVLLLSLHSIRLCVIDELY